MQPGEVWMELHVLHQHGWSISALAREFGLNRRTVQRELASPGPRRYPERALRPAVLWRKGSFGCDSEAGSRFAERLLTVAATGRQQGRGLLDFLVAAGEAALLGTAPPSLLPTGQGG